MSNPVASCIFLKYQGCSQKIHKPKFELSSLLATRSALRFRRIPGNNHRTTTGVGSEGKSHALEPRDKNKHPFDCWIQCLSCGNVRENSISATIIMLMMMLGTKKVNKNGFETGMSYYHIMVGNKHCK